MKKVIINADDFGMSKIFNEVILELLEKELVRSTSVLVTRGLDGQLDQIERLKEIMKRKNISVGLHFESDKKDVSNVKENIEIQSDSFVRYFGFKPTHIDKHKDIHSKEESEAMVDFALKNNIYIRNVFADYTPSRGNNIKTSHHTIFLLEESVDGIKNYLLDKLRDGELAEVVVHPGKFDPYCESSLNKIRENDYKKIIDLFPLLKENHIAIINQKIENF